MNYRGLLLIGLTISLVVGCGRKVVPSTTTEVRDSLIIKEIPKIIEVPVPGETVTVTEYIECDSITNKPKPKKFTATNGRANVNVNIDAEGKATASGGCDSLTAKIQVLEREVSHFRKESMKEVIPIIEFKTRKIDTFCRWFTGIGLFIFGVLAFIKIKKFIP
jgi:hypothetical protein